MSRELGWDLGPTASKVLAGFLVELGFGAGWPWGLGLGVAGGYTTGLGRAWAWAGDWVAEYWPGFLFELGFRLGVPDLGVHNKDPTT